MAEPRTSEMGGDFGAGDLAGGGREISSAEEVLAAEVVFRFWVRAEDVGADAAVGDADVFDEDAAGAHPEGGGEGGDVEVFAFGDFVDFEDVGERREGDDDARDEFVGGQDAFFVAGVEGVDVDAARAVGAGEFDLGVEDVEGGGCVGDGRAVGDVAAKGAGVFDGWRAEPLASMRASFGEVLEGGEFEVGEGGAGARR